MRYNIHLIALLRLLYIIVQSLSNHISASWCCQVLRNLPLTGTTDIAGSCPVFVNVTSSVATANQGHRASFMLNLTMWLNKKPSDPVTASTKPTMFQGEREDLVAESAEFDSLLRIVDD